MPKSTPAVYSWVPMKNPRRFHIPLKWLGTTYIEKVRADVMVLPWDDTSYKGITYTGKLGGKSQYAVHRSYSQHGRYESTVTSSKLELMPIGSHVLVEQSVFDITMYVTPFRDGLCHGIQHLSFRDRRWFDQEHPEEATVETLCGIHHIEHTDRFPVKPGQPTCSDCLQVKSAWFHYLVEPYVHPHEAEKAKRKIHARERRRTNYPTAYDHLLLDPFAEDAVQPSPPLRAVSPKPEIFLPGTRGQRQDRLASGKRSRSYAEEKAEILRKIRGR